MRSSALKPELATRLSVALFSRIAVSEIRHGERKQFQAAVIMDTHGPSRPLLVEKAGTFRRELARHCGRVLAGSSSVDEIGAVGIDDRLVVFQMKIIHAHWNSLLPIKGLIL